MFVYFLGVLVRACPILRFRVLFIFFWFLGLSYPYSSSNVLRGPVLCPCPIHGFIDRYF